MSRCIGLVGLLLAVQVSAIHPDAPAELVHTLSGHTDIVYSVAFSHDGKRVASGGLDKMARVWDVESGDELVAFDAKYSVNGIGFSPNDKLLGTGSWGGQVWDLAIEQRKHQLESHTGFVTCAAMFPDGKTMATGSLDGTAKLYDIESGNETRNLEQGEQVTCLAVTADGKKLATGGDSMIRIWETATGKRIGQIKTPTVTALAFTLDGLALFAGHGDKLARRWDVSTGKETLKFAGHSDRVISVALSPNGKRIATGSADHTVRFWNSETGELEGELKAHDGAVNAVAWSTDGKLLGTGSADKTVKLWKVH